MYKRQDDERFQSFKIRIFERDLYTCQYCGFQAFDHMCVVNKDQNYKNNQGSNLITACPFCAQCHFVCMVGESEFGGGTMIYAPEMSQEDINGLCHVIFCAVANGSEQANLAQSIYNNLRLRSNVLEKQLGKGMSDPNFFSQMLIETPLENKVSITSNILQSTRLLPSRNGFSSQIMNWSKQSLEDF